VPTTERTLVHRLSYNGAIAATGRGPQGCVENGSAAALLVGYVSIQICALLPPVRLLAPCRRPILNATMAPVYERRCTSYARKIHPPKQERAKRTRGKESGTLESVLIRLADRSARHVREQRESRDRAGEFELLHYLMVRSPFRAFFLRGETL
jgi:hypothetical protein